MEQMVFRMCPPGFTGDSIKELNVLLANGWNVVRVDKIKYDNSGTEYNDYLLERKKNG